MKTRPYLFTTTAIFVLVVAAHVARVIAEGVHLLHEPSFLVTTALAVAMVVWSVMLLRANRDAK